MLTTKLHEKFDRLKRKLICKIFQVGRISKYISKFLDRTFISWIYDI